MNISTRIHIASSNPALFGMFTACGKHINPRTFRTQLAGSQLTDQHCARCRAAITGKLSMPTVADGIKHVEEAGWKLTFRGAGVYYFENLNAAPHCQTLVFTLSELRDAVKNGF